MQLLQSNIPQVQKPAEKEIQYEIKHMEYCQILVNHQILYKAENQWLFALNKENVPDIFFHLSVCVAQAAALFNVVFPILKTFNVTFRVIRNTLCHYQLNGGFFGTGEIGKVITVWSANKEQACHLIKALVPHVQQFRGPAPTESYYKIGAVFYFEAGNKKHTSFAQELNIGCPVTFSPFPQKTRLIGKYVPVKMIKYSPKGNIYKGHSLINLSLSACLIKEGKADMAEDGVGRDVKHRLLWEKTVLEEIYNVAPAPRVLKYLEQKQNGYLILEWLDGHSLGDAITNIRGGQAWNDLIPTAKRKIMDYLLAAIVGIRKLHQTGYVHRDLNESNIIISSRGSVYIIDFEIAYHIATNRPSPAFFYGMPGYAAPEQLRHATPTLKEDIYSIGALISRVLTGIKAEEIPGMECSKLKNIIDRRLHNIPLRDMIMQCLEPVPRKRPAITELEEMIRTISL